MKIDLKANEIVLKATDSEFFPPDQQISGKLILTNQRLYFKSNCPECISYNLEILPDELKEILPYKRGWLSGSGLNLVTKNGRELKFVMKKKDEWELALNKIY